jgi:small subunit ribosomal protein S9
MAEKTKSDKKQETRRYIYANGRRKSSVARVRLYPAGKGVVIVNENPLKEWSDTDIQAEKILAPLKVTNNLKNIDIEIKISGGGPHSQSEAIRHGVSHALIDLDENLRPTLKKLGFLTRDPRSKERKKFGRKKARKSPQFSKR